MLPADAPSAQQPERSNQMTHKYKEATLDAMGRYEQSFNGETLTYEKKMEQCFIEAFTDSGKPDLARPFYLAASSWWNDLEIWAQGEGQ